MADSKKYDGSQWEHSLRKLTTATDTLTTLPADIYADGTNATVGIKGNMSQTGTPTPSSPIQPSETGERTGNLLDESDVTYDGTRNVSYLTNNPYRLDANEEITVSLNYECTAIYIVNASNNINLKLEQNTDTVTYTRTSALNIYIKLRFDSGVPSDLKVMLNTGSTALPYEPYGYKIPILSASTITPVYLGEVQTTRKIKKLALSSSQNWQLQSINSHGIANFYITITNDFLDNSSVISNYFTRQTTTIADTTTEGMIIALSTITTTVYIRIKSQTASTAQEFKDWLDGLSEEAAIWYVLAEPTTGIVNEPIRKIGDYADTVSGITIPTITGADSFDVLTTLKPSEVDLTYTGWHDAMVEEWDGSQWQ